MEHNDRIDNSQKKAIEKQLNSMTAYGIDGFELVKSPKETVGNEDIEAERRAED